MAQGSVSDCRYMGHEFKPIPAIIIVVKVNHKIHLRPSIPFHLLKNGNCQVLTDLPMLVLGGL